MFHTALILWVFFFKKNNGTEEPCVRAGVELAPLSSVVIGPLK